MFCSDCGSEYVEGIRECSDCGTKLVNAISQSDDAKDAEALRMVYIAGLTEGSMIKELLNNNNVTCILQGEVSATTLPTAGELTQVRVWVRASDQANAHNLIEAFFQTGDSLSNRED